MLLLWPSIQNYAWGKVGSSSIVAKFFRQLSPGSNAIDENMPYAELWIGTHPNGPSYLAEARDTSLKSILTTTSVGYVPSGYSSVDIPFILKVLSIRTALSIQAHPDKQLAPILHEKFPQHFKDSNHKPEMCIALSPFKALCGFLPISEIKQNLMKYPELCEIIGKEESTRFLSSALTSSDSSTDEEKRHAIKIIFSSFMCCPDDIAEINICSVVKRLQQQCRADCSRANECNSIESLIVALAQEYPSDRGILCPLFLNFLQLNPGEAFFMEANELHAYLSGDCIECMALSDNTVRAGLTVKPKDVDILCNMLHYRNGDAQEHYVKPVNLVENKITLYRPPIEQCPEFEVSKVELEIGHMHCFPSIPAARIGIVTQGFAKAIIQTRETCIIAGKAFFIPANCHVQLYSVSNVDELSIGESKLIMFLANANLGFS